MKKLGENNILLNTIICFLKKWRLLFPYAMVCSNRYILIKWPNLLCKALKLKVMCIMCNCAIMKKQRLQVIGRIFYYCWCISHHPIQHLNVYKACHHAARSQFSYVTSLLMSPCTRSQPSRPSTASLFPFPQSQLVFYWWSFFHSHLYKKTLCWKKSECVFNWVNKYKVGNLQRDLKILDE